MFLQPLMEINSSSAKDDFFFSEYLYPFLIDFFASEAVTPTVDAFFDHNFGVRQAELRAQYTKLKIPFEIEWYGTTIPSRGAANTFFITFFTSKAVAAKIDAVFDHFVVSQTELRTQYTS